MNFKFLATVLLLIVWKTTSLIGQVAEYYFSDNELKQLGKVTDHIRYDNSIIIAGRNFEKVKFHPVLIRIDTLGNTIWNTADNDTSVYSSAETLIDKCFLGNDGFIYALCITSQVDEIQIWKVDPGNGNIIWKKASIQNTSIKFPEVFMDYDSTRFIYSHSSYNGLVYDTWIEIVNKTTGNSTGSVKIGDLPYSRSKFGLCIDNQKNLYLSRLDTIVKISALNPNLTLWKVSYPSEYVDYFNTTYYDTSTTSVYFIGKQDHPLGGFDPGKILKINSVNGSLLSSFSTQVTDALCNDLLRKDNFLYLTWKHIYTGGGTYRFHTIKYDLTSDTAAWQSQYGFLEGNSVPVGGTQSSLSFDVNSKDDVYLTGYYGSGKWGILKLNGTDGSSYYEKEITRDSIYTNSSSSGMAVCLFNDVPYFVGNLEVAGIQFNPFNLKQSITLVKLDSTSGNVDIMKFIDGKYKFPSKTLAIKNYPQDKTIILKQFGKKLLVEMYDPANNILWSKELFKDYHLKGYGLSVSPNGEIFLSAAQFGEYNLPPYYQPAADSIFIFRLNGNGILSSTFKFYAGTIDTYPLELYADDVNTLLFYRNGVSSISSRRITSSSITIGVGASIMSTPGHLAPKQLFDINSDSAFIFRKWITTNALVKVDKNLHTYTYIKSLPTIINTINFVHKADSHLVVLAGKSNNDREVVSLYNIITRDTVWTKIISTSTGQVLKCITDSAGNFIYTVGQSAGNLTVRKINIQNGMVLWTYNYNGAVGFDEYPLDLSFDNKRRYVLITGQDSLSNSTASASVIVIDSLGSVYDVIQKPGDVPGEYSANCIQMMPNGAIWAGGYLNKNPYGPAGFIFELDSTIVPPPPPPPPPSPFQWYYRAAVPFPYMIQDLEIINEDTSYVSLWYHNLTSNTFFSGVNRSSDDFATWDTMYSDVSNLCYSRGLQYKAPYLYFATSLNNNTTIVLRTRNGSIWDTLFTVNKNIDCFRVIDSSQIKISYSLTSQNKGVCETYINNQFSYADTTLNFRSVKMEFLDTLGFMLGGPPSVVNAHNIVRYTPTTGYNTVYTSTGNLSNLLNMHFPSRTVGYAVGRSGTILRTMDSGITWTQLVSNSIETLRTTFFLNDSCGYVAGHNSTLLYTNDYGANWHPQTVNSSTNFLIKHIKFLNDSLGYIFGTAKVYKTVNSGVVWTEENPKPKTTLKVFPNPAHELCYVSIPEQLKLKPLLHLSVYDVKGHIVIKHYIPNYSSFQLSITELNYGIYTLVLSDGDAVYTGKLIKGSK